MRQQLVRKTLKSADVWEIEASADGVVIRFGELYKSRRTRKIPLLVCINRDPEAEVEKQIERKLAEGFVISDFDDSKKPNNASGASASLPLELSLGSIKENVWF